MRRELQKACSDERLMKPANWPVAMDRTPLSSSRYISVVSCLSSRKSGPMSARSSHTIALTTTLHSAPTSTKIRMPARPASVWNGIRDNYPGRPPSLDAARWASHTSTAARPAGVRIGPA